MSAAAEEGSSLTNDMIACWPLDEDSGTREDDWAAFDLTDNNTVTGTTGPVGLGNASSFDTVLDEFLNHADHSSLRFGAFDSTFVAWANVTIGTPLPTILSKHGTSDNGYVLYWDDSDDKFEFVVYNTVGGSATAISSSTYAAGSWHFIVCGYNSTTGEVFISVNNSAYDVANLTGTPRSSTAEFRIGSRNDTEVSFNGGIAGVALWDRLLTAGEITTLFASGDGSPACAQQGN